MSGHNSDVGKKNVAFEVVKGTLIGAAIGTGLGAAFSYGLGMPDGAGKRIALWAVLNGAFDGAEAYFDTRRHNERVDELHKIVSHLERAQRGEKVGPICISSR